MLKILRCGWCGVFCDNEGRVFEPTEQLIKADEIVGFENSKGTCEKCYGDDSLHKDTEENELNTSLADMRARFNRKLSTGD